MPILIVNGMPSGVSGLDKLTESLCRSVESVPEFALSRFDVTVFYPADLLQERLGEEIILIVEGFFAKPQRTFELQKQWIQTLQHEIWSFSNARILQCRKIEVLLKPFDPEMNAFTSMTIH